MEGIMEALGVVLDLALCGGAHLPTASPVLLVPATSGALGCGDRIWFNCDIMEGRPPE